MFCRVFLVSCDILNPGSGYAKHRILFKQVFGILLQQCHGNWNHPCNTRGPFSGNVFFLPSFLDLWSKIVPVSHLFSLFFLKFVDLFNKCLESKSCYLTSNRYSQNLLFFPLYAFLCVICLFSLVQIGILIKSALKMNWTKKYETFQLDLFHHMIFSMVFWVLWACSSHHWYQVINERIEFFDREWSFCRQVERARLQFLYTHHLCVSTFSSHFQIFIHHRKKVHFYFIIIFVQVGLGTFLLRYLPGLLHSILMEMGISEDMYYPVCKL